MADIAHAKTDKKLEEMEKRLSAIYSRAEKEIGKHWKEYLAESQAEIDELQKAYELAKRRRCKRNPKSREEVGERKARSNSYE